VGIMPDSSPFGSQTVMGPAWPNVDEEQLTAAAASYEKLATTISGNIVPQQTNQLMKLTEVWQGAGSLAASGEATTMIAGHEANAAQAQAIAAQLTQMAAAVVKTKMAVNAAAQEVQHEVEALQALPFGNKQELIESRIKMGLSQNIATVTASTTELASALGTTANIPQMTTPPTAQAQQAVQKGADQGAQMAMQMASQLPQMLGQVPQQLAQPLQQFQPVHARHLDVEDGEVGRVFQQRLQRGLAVAIDPRGEALRLQGDRHGGQYVAIVVDQRDALLRGLRVAHTGSGGLHLGRRLGHRHLALVLEKLRLPAG